jgi:hypothetical protein
MNADPLRAQGAMTLDDLAAIQNVEPLESLEELAADVWDSDAELDAFLQDVRRSRNVDARGMTSVSTRTSPP